jgi:RNA polymerase sigma-70 factor (ECF subfamily)
LRYFAVRLGSPAAAEDVVQEIYLKLAALPADAEVQNNAAFLYRLGSNLMLDRLRQQRRSLARDAHWRDAQVSLVEGQEVAEDSPADEAVISRQRLQLMLGAIEELPPPVQRAFRLHKLEGLSQAETAQAMGVSRSSVEKYISAALKRLLARLG